LSSIPLPAPLKWDMVEGVIATAAPEEAKSGAAKAVVLMPTNDGGFHRVGFSGNYGGGNRTYHVTIWVKGAPSTNVMLEARGNTLLSPGVPADYGRAFFDLTKNQPQPNQLVSPKTKFPATSITQDGDWHKISADMRTRDGWLYFVLGLTSKGSHVFVGTADMALTIGGAEVAPVG
jgi:hypothetical protein